MTTELYGHAIDLTTADDVEDGVVTDVLVVARAVRYNDEGRAEDALLISATDSTSSIVQQGMANDLLLGISLTRGAYDDNGS